VFPCPVKRLREQEYKPDYDSQLADVRKSRTVAAVQFSGLAGSNRSHASMLLIAPLKFGRQQLVLFLDAGDRPADASDEFVLGGGITL
jgi:hypothetical protein